jgi:hypothetical protein
MTDLTRLLLHPGGQVLEVAADCLLDHLSIARPVNDDRAGILELTERKERKPARELDGHLRGR